MSACQETMHYNLFPRQAIDKLALLSQCWLIKLEAPADLLSAPAVMRDRPEMKIQLHGMHIVAMLGIGDLEAPRCRWPCN